MRHRQAEGLLAVKRTYLKRGVLRWARAFRAAAKANQYALLRDHLRRLGLPDFPELLLEGTIHAAWACSSYFALDHRRHQDKKDFDHFLELQQYNPGDAIDTVYTFTFDLHGKAFARVMVETKVETLDLADLYGNPWLDYEVVGYRRVWVTRADWAPLTDEELQDLEQEVTSDLRYDYAEDELALRFEASEDKKYLLVVLQDVSDSEKGGDGQV